MSGADVLKAFEEALEARDGERLDELTRTLAAELRTADPEQPDAVVPERTGQKILDRLKARLCFDQLATLGAALAKAFPDNDRIWRLYAQGLIDSGQLDRALEVLERFVEESGISKKERIDAWGLIGRVHKQSYLDSTAPPDKKARWLQASFDAYLLGWSEAREAYHGINLVALLGRAERDGLVLDTDLARAELATEVLHEAEDLIDDGQEGWTYVIAMEASLALGDEEEAIEWAETYVKKGLQKKKGEFEFASTLRQLKELWAVDLESKFGAAVVPMLEAVVLDRGLRSAKGSGSINLESADVARMGSPDTFARLERVFGDAKFVSMDWLQTLLARLGAIGVVNEMGKGIGTGFVVRGSTLAESLGEDWLFVTNSHVVTDDDDVIDRAPSGHVPSRPEDVTITFEAHFRGKDDEFKVAELVWTSPPEDLDVSILRLDRPVYEGLIEPYPVSNRLEDPSTKPRLYIAGHPGGGGLRIAMHDNHLIDFDDRKIHYRTPTNPGSSGSPVFNDKWKLVGLHHAGSSEMPRLDGSGETIEANEGIRLGAILDGLKAALEEKEGADA